MRLKNENFAYVLDWLVRHKKVDGQKGLAHLTGRVYAVDVTDETIYNSEKDVKARFQEVKGELQQARDDFRDATYRLNLLIEKIQNKSDDPSNIGIAADN